MYPIGGAVTFKSTVGTNVASDALANLASSGITGEALIIVLPAWHARSFSLPIPTLVI